MATEDEIISEVINDVTLAKAVRRVASGEVSRSRYGVGYPYNHLEMRGVVKVVCTHPNIWAILPTPLGVKINDLIRVSTALEQDH